MPTAVAGDSPLVLVPTQSATRADASPGAELVEALNRAYVAALQGVGLIPILLPTQGPLPLDLSWVGGLLLPGGPDVEPGRYGGEPEPLTRPDPASDELEFGLANWAIRAEIPILAICRGLQVLNVALGGSLTQDLTDHAPRAEVPGPARRDRLAHGLTIDPTSQLGQIVGPESVQVNSLHHQGIERLAPGLRATAWAPEGLIEAFEMPDRRFGLGVQYHPEELGSENRAGRALFQAFAQACREGRPRSGLTPGLTGSRSAG